MNEDVLSTMRVRAALCRRLASSTSDERTAGILSQMAQECERDISRLELKGEKRP
jgi:hypothetical protein